MDRLTSKIRDKVADKQSVNIVKELSLVGTMASDKHVGALASILGDVIDESPQKA